MVLTVKFLSLRALLTMQFLTENKMLPSVDRQKKTFPPYGQQLFSSVIKTQTISPLKQNE